MKELLFCLPNLLHKKFEKLPSKFEKIGNLLLDSQSYGTSQNNGSEVELVL